MDAEKTIVSGVKIYDTQRKQNETENFLKLPPAAYSSPELSTVRTLLSVGTLFFGVELQSVHGGEKEYEPICYRHSY